MRSEELINWRLVGVLFVLVLCALVWLSGCAAMRGQESTPETGRVDTVHSHKGGIEERSIRTLWIRNGTRRAVRVTIDCPTSEWPAHEVPALTAQGFEEWQGECTAVITDR